MKKNLTNILYAIAMLGIVSCSKQPATQDIIVSKPVETKEKATVKMDAYEFEREIDWLEKKYTIKINRFPDESLPIVKDESDQEYYDNKIEMLVVRADGSVFFNRTFAKADFSNHLDEHFKKEGAMLGIVFDKTNGNDLIFAGSIGSPARTSDEYIPLKITLSRMGNITIEKDIDIEASHEQTTDEEDGV